MPTYEYGCDACGAKYELEQRITEEAIKTCEKCGKSEAKRLISGGNFMLKGGGWYADGYARGNNKSAPPNATEASAPSASPDSKPAPVEPKATTTPSSTD